MNARGTIIAALVAVEIAILGEGAVALRGDSGSLAAEPIVAARSAGNEAIVEGAAPRAFDAGAHPVLTVDIGYADLTIRASTSSKIEVSVRPSMAYGAMRATAPIRAHLDGETLTIDSTGGPSWSVGDDRLVTVLVPRDTKVTVAGAGDIRASGLRAESSFKSTGRGSVTIDDYDAPSLEASSRGEIALHQVIAGRLDATSRDGRVEGTALQVRDGSIESDERVILDFANGSDTLINAETGNGRVRASGFAGSASNAALVKSESTDDDGSAESVRIGAGNGRLNVHASDGNIDLTHQG
jgi:hypothetical protein